MDVIDPGYCRDLRASDDQRGDKNPSDSIKKTLIWLDVDGGAPFGWGIHIVVIALQCTP